MLDPGWISSMLPEPEARRVRQWTTAFAHALPDGPAVLIRLPGVGGFGPAQQATLDATRRIVAGRVCVLGPGTAPLALWAARAGAIVTGWHDSLAEALATEATFAANALRPPEIIYGWEQARARLPSCDLALAHLPRGRELQARLLQIAEVALVPGGRLIFTGAKNEGFGSALATAKERFGQAGVVSRKGGFHAALAYRSTTATPVLAEACQSHAILVAGEPTELVSCTGAFAGDRLDAGAAALIAAMHVDSGSRVLDLGCGTGLVGLTALRRGASVTGTDVSSAAVTSTQRTWTANGYDDAVAHLTVGAANSPNAVMDTVVTNPPFHRGRNVDFDVAQLFVKEAARVLRNGGSLYLVANAFLDYAKWLEREFRTVSIAWENPQFRVWRALR